MPRRVAFLRSINVGKRRVKMATLRECCSALGLRNVETHLASGNLIFDGDKLQVTHAGGRYGNAAVVCDKAYPTHGITTTKFKIVNSHDNRGRGMQFGIVTAGFENLTHWIGQDIHSWVFCKRGQ